MSQVENVNSPVLVNYLLNNKIKLFNLKSEVLAYFALILKDGFLKSYINYSDFSQDKRELIKRHFYWEQRWLKIRGSSRQISVILRDEFGEQRWTIYKQEN